MSNKHPPDWSIDVAMRIWRKFGPHVVDSKKVIEMAWVVAGVILEDRHLHEVNDLPFTVQDKVLLDMLEQKHRSAMLVGFVAMLPQSPECNIRQLLIGSMMEGKPE